MVGRRRRCTMRVAVVALGLLMVSTAFAQMRGSSLSKTDQDFVNRAAQANLGAIKLAELGVKKGSTPEIRKSSQKIIEDNKNAENQLQFIAARDNFALPAEPNAEQRATYERLSKLSGAEFDSALLDALKSDHQKALSLFTLEAQHG